MAIYHNNANVCSGNKGGSAVASAAYQAGEKLYSEIDKEIKDYTRKENVLDNGIVKPEHAPDWCLNREKLWNEVEKVEGIDGQYARKHELALPRELSLDEQKELVKKYCNELSSQGMVCDWAIHNNKKGTNPHVHIMTIMRPFDENGEWGQNFSKPFVEPIDLIVGNGFIAASCMFRKDVLISIKGYRTDPRYYFVEDYELFQRLYVAGYRGANLQEPLYKYREYRQTMERRRLRNRIHGAMLKARGINDFKLSSGLYIYVVRGVIIGLLPPKLYRYLHRRKYS